MIDCREFNVAMQAPALSFEIKKAQVLKILRDCDKTTELMEYARADFDRVSAPSESIVHIIIADACVMNLLTSPSQYRNSCIALVTTST